jgi:RNA polymerase sigma-70 factor, ECF subfamily
MIEGKRVVAGEWILSRAVSIDRSETEGSRAETADLIESLVREHSRMVYRIAYAALRSHHDAEDATQETFLRVLRYSSKLKRVEEPKPWLARIAWRVAVDRSKRRERVCEQSLDDPARPVEDVIAVETSAAETTYGTQFATALEKLIATLPDKLREPLILSTIEEMTPREVAAALGISEAAVRSRAFRARQILKEKLSQYEVRKMR